MLGSIFVYLGAVLTCLGLIGVARPVRRLGIGTRPRAIAIAACGVVLSAGALAAPTSTSRVTRVSTRLDEVLPEWQFHERHAIRIDAPPERVLDAVKRVTANEIFLFRTLTWMRRFGRPSPPNILNPDPHAPLIEVAIGGGFVNLGEVPRTEIVVGTAVVRPTGVRRVASPDFLQARAGPGFALAAMNFHVVSEGAAGSILSTETRVFATDPSASRRFGRYWRVIYPGSAFIRRMWLRAVKRRAELGARSSEFGGVRRAGPQASKPRTHAELDRFQPSVTTKI